MKHGQKARKKPLLTDKQGLIFLSLIEDDKKKQIAKLIFCEGVTNADVADITYYSKRSIERIRIDLLKEVLIKLIEKQIPKKPDLEGDGYDDNGELIYDTGYCPNCRHVFEVYYDSPKHCPDCGQALDWSEVDAKKRSDTNV